MYHCEILVVAKSICKYVYVSKSGWKEVKGKVKGNYGIV